MQTIIRRVFISSTSADLASYRNDVKETLLTKGALPVEQTNFPPDFRSVESMLEAKIRDCDAVVCLVGLVYGAEPAERPHGRARRSYTQMEYDIARRLGKPVYQFLAASSCAFDSRPEESVELQELQSEHRRAIESGDLLWEVFADHNQLRQRIAQIQFDRPVPDHVHPQNLPYVSLGTLFKGREVFLSRIRERLLARCRGNNANYATAITQREALCGLGGIGKTRLAVEYGWRYEDEYSAVLFVVADSPENLRRNIAQLTGPLVLNLPEQSRQEEEVKTAAVIRWLLEHPGWFLILDNVDTRSAAQAVEDLLARIPNGHVLITSRLEDWSKDVEPLELDVLSETDAKAFLLERTKDRRRITTDDDTDAAILSRELDGLALALEQAGAFIERQRCSMGDYVKRWRAGEARVRQWFDPRLMHYPQSVAITYDTTMREVGPAAVALFDLLAWFAPDPLPQGIVEGSATVAILKQLAQNAGVSIPEVIPEEALAELVAFSMVKKSDTEGFPCITQHRLVQELARKKMPIAEQEAAMLGAVRLLGDFAPKDSYRYETWREWRLLVSHAEALWPRVRDLSRDRWSLELMDGLALYYLGQRRYAEAIPIQRLALEVKEERFGCDSSQVFLAKNDLALTLNCSRQSTEAQCLYREALAGWEKTGSCDYEFGSAETMHNLGSSLMGSREFEEAEGMLRRSLALFEAKAGEYHWRTLMTEYSLANTLLAKGETEEAIRLLRLNIEKKAEHLPGKQNHPDTLDSMLTLARILNAQGKLSESEILARRAIEGREQSLGKDDPATLEAVALLVQILAQAGKTTEASELQNRILYTEIRSGNPASLLSARQAASHYFLSGDLAGAEKILRALLKGHFEVASTHCHLARLFIVMDREQDAQDEVARAWEVRAGTPSYVIPRIIWLQMALASQSSARAGISPDLLSLYLGRLKTALQADNAFMEWTMTRVLDHLKPRLLEHDYEVLVSLVSALSDGSKVPDLDRFPEWRNQPPTPLDTLWPNCEKALVEC